LWLLLCRLCGVLAEAATPAQPQRRAPLEPAAPRDDRIPQERSSRPPRSGQSLRRRNASSGWTTTSCNADSQQASPGVEAEAGPIESAAPAGRRGTVSRGSARLLHPSGVAEVGQGQERVVVARGDRGWCCANPEAAASAEATCASPAPSARHSASAPAARLTERSNRQRPPCRAAASAQNEQRPQHRHRGGFLAEAVVTAASTARQLTTPSWTKAAAPAASSAHARARTNAALCPTVSTDVVSANSEGRRHPLRRAVDPAACGRHRAIEHGSLARASPTTSTFSVLANTTDLLEHAQSQTSVTHDVRATGRSFPCARRVPQWPPIRTPAGRP
jgi:hypothetical protein